MDFEPRPTQPSNLLDKEATQLKRPGTRTLSPAPLPLPPTLYLSLSQPDSQSSPLRPMHHHHLSSLSLYSFLVISFTTTCLYNAWVPLVRLVRLSISLSLSRRFARIL